MNYFCRILQMKICYADDPLSWGDEKQSREIYEEMLEYYETDSLDGWGYNK